VRACVRTSVILLQSARQHMGFATVCCYIPCLQCVGLLLVLPLHCLGTLLVCSTAPQAQSHQSSCCLSVWLMFGMCCGLVPFEALLPGLIVWVASTHACLVLQVSAFTEMTVWC
jgi:hypothetical protein